MPFKLTTAQQLMLHVLESTVASVVITVVVGAIQFIATHGFNLGELGLTCATLFLGALSMGYKSVTGNPNFGQAMLDSLAEIKSLLPSASAPPVVVNVQHPATVSTSQAPVQPQPPVQQQFQQPTPFSRVPDGTFPVPAVPKP